MYIVHIQWNFQKKRPIIMCIDWSFQNQQPNMPGSHGTILGQMRFGSRKSHKNKHSRLFGRTVLEAFSAEPWLEDHAMHN